MTLHHYDPSELDRADPALDDVAERLERYAAETPDAVPPDLVARIQAAIEAQPPAPASLWVAFLRAMRGPARAAAVAAVLVAAVVGALAVGELAELAAPDVGSSPVPSVIWATSTPSALPEASPSPPPSPLPSLSPSPSPSPSPTPSSTPMPPSTVQPTLAPPPATPAASASDDDLETPEPSGSDDSSGSGSDGDD